MNYSRGDKQWLRCAGDFIDGRGLWLLLVFAVVYYSLYFDTGLKLTGEQGSNALLAMRLLGGERPVVDVFLGYNVLWFYPLTAIFSVLGPHWLAMRIFFLLVAVLTGLLGYSLVRRVTGLGWLALAAASPMILMPGAIFRNYMGLLGILASWVLVRGYVLEAGSSRRQIAWMGVAGAGMSVCFLLRIEPGLLLALVWAGLTVLYPLAVRGEFLTRLRTIFLGTLAALTAFAAVHAPFVVDAYRRGFGPQFIGQYTSTFGLLQWEFTKEFGAEKPSAQTDEAAQRESVRISNLPDGDSSEAELGSREGRRQLPPLSLVFQGGRIYFHAAGMWFPVLLAPLLVLSGLVMLGTALVRSEARLKELSLVILTTTGCSLALFPQYFFFRPDTTHLNEFMVPFWAATACSSWAIFAAARGRRIFCGWAWLIAGLSVLQAVVSLNALFGRGASGSISGGRGMDARFSALNGVWSRVEGKELADWEGLRDTVLAHSTPGDFVITYPYVPIVNVMCDRPTYQWSLYVDNATVSPKFFAMEAERIGKRQPAVIVVNNRAINKTEHSRFRSWAAPLQAYIEANYVPVGDFFGEIAVYARPDKVRATGQ